MLASSDKATIVFDFWPIGRPMTKTWGSGGVWKRLVKLFGSPDVAFGKTDGIPDEVPFFDRKNGHKWKSLPLANDQFEFGYWDPPYDKLYKPEGREIWRVCKRLAILHTHVYPTSWFADAKREGMVAVTMGPLKQIRILQVFTKQPAATLDGGRDPQLTLSEETMSRPKRGE